MSFGNLTFGVKSKAIACARRCRSSRLTGWWTKKNIKWMAEEKEEEERHKGSLTPKKLGIWQLGFRQKW
jgi:hypothetical protein